MKKSFRIANVRCEGCANTIKKALEEHFGKDVEVDLSVAPRIVTVNLGKPEDEDLLKATLRKLGYPQVDEKVTGLEGAVLKGKSFVSCAVGKFGTDDTKK